MADDLKKDVQLVAPKVAGRDASEYSGALSSCGLHAFPNQQCGFNNGLELL